MLNWIGIKFDRRNFHKNVSSGCGFRDRREVTVILNVLLTVHLGIIFVNNQLDAQFFFMYVYSNSLHFFFNILLTVHLKFRACLFQASTCLEINLL